MTDDAPKLRGFQHLTPAHRAAIASEGGKASSGRFVAGDPRAREAGRKGGQNSTGNFKHNRERAVELGRIGGKASPGNFAANPARAQECGRVGGAHNRGRARLKRREQPA